MLEPPICRTSLGLTRCGSEMTSRVGLRAGQRQSDPAGSSSDELPLAYALAWPLLGILALMAWVALSLHRPLAWPALALVSCSTLLIYGLDRWQDRGRPPGLWKLAGLLLVLIEVGVMLAWWKRAEQAHWGWVVVYYAGQSVGLVYAQGAGDSKGLKYLPGCKSLIVAAVVSGAVLVMNEAFALVAGPPRWWARVELWSCGLFLAGWTSFNAMLFDLRDADEDAAAGVPSLAVLLGPQGARRLALGVVVLTTLASLILLWRADRLGVAHLGPRLLALFVALAIYAWSRKKRPGAQYFWVLDGALLLPWLLALAWGVALA